MIVTHNKHVIEMFSDAAQLPAVRYQLFNLNVLLDAHIGSDLNGLDTRLTSSIKRMEEDVAGAQREIVNYSQAVRWVMAKSSPALRSFICMCKSIDGSPISIDELTDDGINKWLLVLDRTAMPMEKIRGTIYRVKKKLRMI